LNKIDEDHHDKQQQINRHRRLRMPAELAQSKIENTKDQEVVMRSDFRNKDQTISGYSPITVQFY